MRRFNVAWAISAIAVLWPICVSAEVQDNDQVAHQIHDVLKESGRMSGSSFVIKYQDGTACLEGRVGSEEQKALALKLTGEVPEITEVVDHLRVEPAKKAANPVVRMLTRPFEKSRSESEDLAAAPPTDLPTSEIDEKTSDTDSVFPESLDSSEPASSGNLLVRQAANLRTIFQRKSQPAPRTLAAEPTEAEPRTMPKATSKCTTCNPAVVRSSAVPRVTQVAKRAGNSTRQASSRSQPTQAGRVRMVPMMEMPDGSLVPVQQAKRAPLGQPIAGQQSGTQSRGKLASTKRSRQSVARRQDVLEGPVDMEPAGPVPGGPVGGPAAGGPLPAYVPGVAVGVAPAYYDQPHMPNYSWPSYAAHPNYAGVTYPRQYSPTAWPYIGPFYPYPQVPLGWRKVTLEWDDGWWFLDFDDTNRSYAY